MRFLLVFWALVVGCGGGGGGAVVPGGGNDPRKATALALLSDCPEPAQEAVRLLRVFRDILNAGAASPPQLTFQAVVGSTVTWTLDSDGDGMDDLNGSVRFRDALGATITPFDLSQLVTSGQRLVTFFVGLDENTQVVLPFAGTGINLSGQFVAVLGTGVVDRLSGNLSDARRADCEGVFSFDPTAFVLLGGLFPNVLFNIQVSDDQGTVLIGTMEVPGAPTATLEVRFAGAGDAFNFFLDLVSGVVSE